MLQMLDLQTNAAMGLEWEWALEISGVQTTYSIVQQIFFCPSVKRIGVLAL